MRYFINKIPLNLINFYDQLIIFKNIFSNKIPVNRDGQENLSCIPFIIISSGRAGTTLLRVILTKNSQISIPPESQFLHDALRKFLSYNYLGWDELVKIVVGELESKKIFRHWEINLYPVYRKLSNIEEKNRSLAKIIDEIYLTFLRSKEPRALIWGDKSPLHTYYINWIDKIFPRIKYIHLIRDGRAVVNSMLNRNYLNNTITKACKRWNKSINIVNKFKKKKNKDDFFELKYEDLVLKPEKIIKKVCSFIDVNFENQMIRSSVSIENYGDTILPHHSNLKKPINKKSIDRWKWELSKKQKNIIYKKLSKNLALLGYL